MLAERLVETMLYAASTNEAPLHCSHPFYIPCGIPGRTDVLALAQDMCIEVHRRNLGFWMQLHFEYRVSGADVLSSPGEPRNITGWYRRAVFELGVVSKNTRGIA